MGCFASAFQPAAQNSLGSKAVGIGVLMAQNDKGIMIIQSFENRVDFRGVIQKLISGEESAEGNSPE